MSLCIFLQNYIPEEQKKNNNKVSNVLNLTFDTLASRVFSIGVDLTGTDP